ncbi:MAG: ROK family protein [Cetobacterium sp.]|uniref:ROK family protein n=1 Tax=Cetobacterium sp. TaxID=2071632 RepID=UPI003EE64274
MNYYVGIDIGGTKIATIVADKNFNILNKKRFLTAETKLPLKSIERIVENIDIQLKEMAITKEDILGIGISCGGPLNSREGVILSPPNLPGWDNVKIVEILKSSFNTKIYLQNDANACALAEWKLGAGKGFENLVFLTFGTGMGAGLILNNRLYCGKQDCAGEVGHIKLSTTGPVGFGKAGSFEGYCSGGGIVKLGEIFLKEALAKGYSGPLKKKYERGSIEAKHILTLAFEGEALSKKIIDESARRLGQGLSILIDILNPEAIVIGSIYSRCENLFKPIVDLVLEKECIEQSLNGCKVVPAELSENVGDLAAIIVASGEY